MVVLFGISNRRPRQWLVDVESHPYCLAIVPSILFRVAVIKNVNWPNFLSRLRVSFKDMTRVQTVKHWTSKYSRITTSSHNDMAGKSRGGIEDYYMTDFSSYAAV